VKLVIPHPGDFLALKEICKEAPGHSEIYMAGTPEVVGSGELLHM